MFTDNEEFLLLQQKQQRIDRTRIASEDADRNRSVRNEGDSALERKKRESTEIAWRNERQNNAKLKEENEKLRLQNEKLERERKQFRNLAINVIADRRSVYNTIDYLKKRWKDNTAVIPDTPIQTQEEFKNLRDQEFKKLENDIPYLEKVADTVDETAVSWGPKEPYPEPKARRLKV